MSQENVEVVRRVYQGWARGDFSEGGVFDSEVEFEMPDWPHGGRSRGLEAMRRTWLASLSAWDDFRAEPEDFIDIGRHVVVLNRIHARGKGSGAEVRASTATVWTLDAGKVVRLVLYWDSAKALEAVGLRGVGPRSLTGRMMTGTPGIIGGMPIGHMTEAALARVDWSLPGETELAGLIDQARRVGVTPELFADAGRDLPAPDWRELIAELRELPLTSAEAQLVDAAEAHGPGRTRAR